MADFKKFFPTLLKFEGGYSNDPMDPGGATNMGITFVMYREYARSVLDVDPTVEHFRQLTQEQTSRIYKMEYWDRIFGDEISFQPLADIVFDFYVNAGHHAITLMFQVLNSAGGHFDVDVKLNARVIDNLKHYDIENVYAAYKAGRKAYYQALAHKHPVSRRYLRGWLRRVDSFPDFGSAQCSGPLKTGGTD